MTDIATKTCSICKQALAATPEVFHRDKQKKDGLSSWCRPCTKAREAAYKAAKASQVASAPLAVATPEQPAEAAAAPTAKRSHHKRIRTLES